MIIITIDCFGYKITALGKTLKQAKKAAINEYHRQYNIRAEKKYFILQCPDNTASFDEAYKYFGGSITELEVGEAVFE
jgi:hypothetical protein